MNNATVKKRYNKGWANLKPIKKGEVRNPNGRPKKRLFIPDILASLLADPAKEDEAATNLQIICITAIEQAKKGDKDARNWIADRTEGKALERALIGELEKEEIKIVE